MEKEVWKPVKGFEEHYEVSNLGQVRRISRIIYRGKGRDYNCYWKGRILKIKNCTVKTGVSPYKQVCLTVGGVYHYKMIHRLVAEAFIPNPGNKPEVNHKNGNKSDNRLINLEWVTSSENKQHRISKLKRGHLVPVRCIETGEEFDSIASASRRIGRNKECIRACLKKPSRTAGGLHWEKT